ncbi:MAG: hypothetical protein DDT32_02180 [Syntrophomonadaceae bacterium]|nr:hypothetical protein [Bacillota bacterium]
MTIEERDQELEEAIAFFSQNKEVAKTPVNGCSQSQFELVVRDTGLAPAKAQVLLKNFQHYFELAGEWEQRAKTLVVTDETQTVVMKLARAGRLHLREKRLAIERTRKELKEQSLREGKAIDGIANVLKALIVPIEEYLGQQENFVQLREAERAEAKRLENERISEEARIAAEKAEAEERIRIRLENERLRAEAQEHEKVLRAEREAAEAAKAEAQRLANRERAKVEQERREIEEELQKVREVERQKIAEEERRIEALKQASDGEKLEQLARNIGSIVFPTSLKNAKARDAVTEVWGLLQHAQLVLARWQGDKKKEEREDAKK